MAGDRMTAQEWTLEPWEYLLARIAANQWPLRVLAAATVMRGDYDDDRPGNYVSEQLTVVMRESFSTRLNELAIGGATERDCLPKEDGTTETIEEASYRAAVRALAFAEGILAEARERKRDAVEHENRDATQLDGVPEVAAVPARD